MLKRITQIFSVILLLLLGFTACDQSNEITSPEPNSEVQSLEKLTMTPINLNQPGQNTCIELVAAKNKVIGNVCMDYLPNTRILKVTYNITDPNWNITKTHLAVSFSPWLLPRKITGRPRLNLFPYKGTHNHVSTVEYNVNVRNLGPNLYVAAHATVEGNDGSGNPQLNPELPQTDVMTPEWTPDEDVMIKSVFDNFGTYLGWSMDNARAVSNGAPRDVKFVSSYSDELPECQSFLEKSENLDLVNWIINNREQNWDRETVQAAIWSLLQPTGGISNWQDPSLPNYFQHDAQIREQIVTAALANGEDYEPPCGGKFLVLVYGSETDPCNLIKNIVGIEMPVECQTQSFIRNAWAFPFQNGTPVDGLSQRFSFFGWARYILYKAY